MKVALCSTIVPFIKGGARQIVEWLEDALVARGHEVERVYLPEVDHPDCLFDQMAAFRWIDLSSADRVICFRPQSHVVRHPHKVLWFIHHIRSYYDLWDDPEFGPEHTLQAIGLREALHRVDTAALREARHVYTNSRVVGKRLLRYNGVASTVLYPPVHRPERFRCDDFGDEIVYVSRIENHKRQHLLVDALAHTQTPVRLRLCGVSADDAYVDRIRRLVSERELTRRVTIENRWISEDEKVAALAGCLASAYLPLDEDSYGYPTLEAAHAGKPTLTTSASGGVLEFVIDGENGLCVDASPEALAGAMDRLYRDRDATRMMGVRARQRIDALGVSWDHVLYRLLV